MIQTLLILAIQKNVRTTKQYSILKRHTGKTNFNEGLPCQVINHFRSARPTTQQTNITKTLEVTYDPTLHLSVEQHATAHLSSPFSLQAFLLASQRSLVVHIIVTAWISSAVLCDLWQVSSEQSFRYLSSSASNFDLEQTVSFSDSLPNSMQL